MRRQRRNFPIGEVRGEDKIGLLAVAEHFQPRVSRVIDRDIRVAGSLRAGRVVDDEAVDMGELGRDASEVVPHAGENLLDLLGGFLRKRGAQIFAPDLVLGKPRAHDAHHAAKHVRHALAIDSAQHCERADRDPAEHPVERPFDRQQERERFSPARHRA